MSSLKRFWHSLLDLLFGNAEVEQRIRSITHEELSGKSRRIILEASVSALFPYQDPLIRDMIWALKYRRNEHVAELFARTLTSFIEDMRIPNPLLIPLPLSRRRKRTRGYNQVELVLSRVKTANPATLDTTSLERIRDTRPQTSLSREKRLTNLIGAFAVRDIHAVHGKDIILVDDVSTTGATLREARKALMNAGASTVHCVALAH
jgi:competence protein ComFC